MKSAILIFLVSFLFPFSSFGFEKKEVSNSCSNSDGSVRVLMDNLSGTTKALLIDFESDQTVLEVDLSENQIKESVYKELKEESKLVHTILYFNQTRFSNLEISLPAGKTINWGSSVVNAEVVCNKKSQISY